MILIPDGQLLSSLLTANEAVVFIHAKWSGPSVLSRRLVKQWEEEVLAKRMPKIEVHEIDCDQEFFNEWMELAGNEILVRLLGGIPTLHMAHHGKGMLFWIHDGQIVDVIESVVAEAPSPNDLSNRTNKVWNDRTAVD